MPRLFPLILAGLLIAPLTTFADPEQAPAAEPTPHIHRVERAADAIQIRLDEGFITIFTNLPYSDEESILRIGDFPGFCTLSLSGDENSVVPQNKREFWAPAAFNFLHRNNLKKGQLLENTQILATPSNLQIARDSESLIDNTTISIIQSPSAHNDEPGVSFRVNRNSKLDLEQPELIHLALTAPSISALIINYPKETAEYLEPIFRDLGQAQQIFSIDSGIAWQVFADALKSDSETIAEIDKLIARFDSADFQDRDAALVELNKYGQVAVTYLNQVDRNKLSAEQRNRIDLFLNSAQPLPPAKVKTLRTDVHFLLDCLYNNDRTLREESLNRLKAITNQPVAFDLDLPPEKRAAAIAPLRKSLGSSKPTTEPTTRPVR